MSGTLWIMRLRAAVWTALAASSVCAQAASPASSDAGAPAAATTADARALSEQLRLARNAKDEMLRLAEDSPIPEEQRARFGGLSYFPPNLEFRLEGDLHRYGRQRRLLAATNADTLLYVVRFGRFVSSYRGSEFALEVYLAEGTDQLSVFFTDPTNGRQTYGGGRYVPLSTLPDGRLLLDFNEAYSPYCAYDGAYICPLPPVQNNLPFAVTAGEKAY